MNTVIAHLNAVIEDRMPTALKAEPCRKALFAIETQQLAVNALRIVVKEMSHLTGLKPEPIEAYHHACRYLALYDKQMAERAAQVPYDGVANKAQYEAEAAHAALAAEDASDLA
jgi:hypothetical protein